MSLPDAAGYELSLFYRLFDKLFPVIRFIYERIMGHVWFSQITPQLWLGGAPVYRRDYEELLHLGITAVVNVRAERADETGFYDQHGIHHVRYLVPDMLVPDEATLAAAVDWITEEVDAGRVVLVHCAKGRGRSATLLAGYLMREQGLSLDEARALMKEKRTLTKLEQRHRVALEAWLRSQAAQQGDATVTPGSAIGDR